MSTKTVTQEQLDAIVGAALRGLVQANASNEQIGRFAVEHRLEMARLLGWAESPPAETDLHSVVMEAVSTALSQAGLKITAEPSRTRYNVNIDGKRTSLTLKTELVAKAREQLGKTGARTLISSLAEAFSDPAHNRSMQVEQRLKMSLEEIGLRPTGEHEIRH